MVNESVTTDYGKSLSTSINLLKISGFFLSESLLFAASRYGIQELPRWDPGSTSF